MIAVVLDHDRIILSGDSHAVEAFFVCNLPGELIQVAAGDGTDSGFNFILPGGLNGNLAGFLPGNHGGASDVSQSGCRGKCNRKHQDQAQQFLQLKSLLLYFSSAC